MDFTIGKVLAIAALVFAVFGVVTSGLTMLGVAVILLAVAFIV